MLQAVIMVVDVEVDAVLLEHGEEYIWPNGPPDTVQARHYAARHVSRAVPDSAAVPTQWPRHGTIMA